MNDHRIDIGDIQSRFNDRCGNKHIDLTADKIIHDPLQLAFLHLSMCKCHICLRYQILEKGRHFRDRVDTVIYIVDLPASGKLTPDRFPHHFFIIFHDKRLDRHTVIRCFFQNTHIPDSHKAHVERTRDRGCCQRQNIYIFLELLDLFLVGNTKTLFLINDQKPQILKRHVL